MLTPRVIEMKPAGEPRNFRRNQGLTTNSRNDELDHNQTHIDPRFAQNDAYNNQTNQKPIDRSPQHNSNMFEQIKKTLEQEQRFNEYHQMNKGKYNSNAQREQEKNKSQTSS